MLLGLLQPTEGEVRVNGRSLADWDASQYRARIGAVMQDDQLFVGTIEDNISFFDAQPDLAWVEECAKVASVRTASIHGKVKRQGRFSGQRPDWKKAWVRLKAGEKVPEIFEGA